MKRSISKIQGYYKRQLISAEEFLKLANESTMFAVLAVGFSVLLSVVLSALPWVIVIGFAYWLFF